jgi:GTP-binding protein EngB required for normal cell division
MSVPDGPERSGPAAGVMPRVAALERSLGLLAGRVDDARLRPGRTIARRAAERLRLSASHTVVALAGATGSGKSSLFNGLVGLDLSAVGVRRPTTGQPHACVWGPEGAGDLLDWLGIPPRLQTARESVLDADTQQELRGLVLLDLPDHDSLEQAHRLEVDRLVQLSDMLIWVLDPQKYADAAVHGRYLRALAGHARVVVIVLNQIDKLSPDETDQCLADLRRLLADDGLGGVRVLATSAVRGDGLADLREVLADAVAQHDAAALRLAADLDGISAGLAGLSGREQHEELDRTAVKRLCATLALAAGVPAVGEAIERTYRERARAAVRWPLARVVRWAVGRYREEPDGMLAPGLSVPEQAVLRAQAESALRDLADTVSYGLPDPWPAHARHAVLNQLDGLPSALGAAVAATDLRVTQRPAWWQRVAWAQYALLAMAAAGLVWLLAPLVGQPAARIGSVPAALLMLVFGLAGGLLLWAVTWVAAAVVAHSVRVHAEAALTHAVAVVAHGHVLVPVKAELRVYAENREALAAMIAS